ncbi:MAG: sugar ABC transporter substrate-binding protein, partial [Actinomycetota bacterium]|nr:sugar ABC transporter substrate-binding protein [Actinomycetota bacterium]
QLLDSEFGDDFDVMPWPALDASTGVPSVPVGAFSSAVSSKTADAEVAKAFVKWLWVDETDFQTDFATSYGFHIPARTSLAEAADVLQEGPAATALKLYQENAFTQTPILWTPKTDTAYSDARSAIIAEGADPAEEIAKVKAVAEEELARIASGETASTAPATTG